MRALVLTLAMALCSGCIAVQAGIHYPFLHTEYGKNGFTVRDDKRTYAYDNEKGRSTLTLADGVVMEDHDRDGRVDVVRAFESEYARGEPGTADLFEDADKRWSAVTEYLSIGHFEDKWAEMKPFDIVERWAHRPDAP